MISIVA